MRLFILFLFIILSWPSFACLNKISPSDLSLVVASGNPLLAETLTYSGQDGVCFDGIDLSVSEIVNGQLVESDAKKAARQVARQAAKDAEDAKEVSRRQSLQDLRDLQPLPDPVGTTVNQLRAELKDAVNRANKLRNILKDVVKDQ